MAYSATRVSPEPLNYFLQQSDEGPFLRVSDIVLRANYKATEIFSNLIRLGTHSQWSHNALLYLINDPPQGFDNTFLVEAMTSGVRVASWRNEVTPFEQFTVGLRRLRLDWYVETPKEKAAHNQNDPEDAHAIGYLRHIRGMAIDQINNLYSHNVINELTALYAARFAQQLNLPEIVNVATAIANWFAMRDENSNAPDSVMRFICSGLVQYSFFSALRYRIMNAINDPAGRDAGYQNLENMGRIIFRPDPTGIIPDYIGQIKAGKIKISDDVPEHVLNFLKTTTPADFNNASNLEWRYVILGGVVWKINAVPDGYKPQGQDEEQVLKLLVPSVSLLDT